MTEKYRFEFQGVPQREITVVGENYEECRRSAEQEWVTWVRAKYPKLFGSFKLKKGS